MFSNVSRLLVMRNFDNLITRNLGGNRIWTVDPSYVRLVSLHRCNFLVYRVRLCRVL